MLFFSTPLPSSVDSSRSWGKWLAYGLFLSLFLFEWLNYMGVLSFQVEFTWIGRMVSTAGVFLILVILDRLSVRVIHRPLSYGILLCGTLLLCIDFWGDILSLYRRYAWYDQMAHFMSGPLLVGAFLQIYEPLAQRLWQRMPPALVSFVSLLTSVFLAVVYELEEYTEDMIYATHRLGDGTDTANDLALNMVGGILFLVAVWLVRLAQKQQQHRAAV